MTTKTITVEPPDARVGDMFTGTVEYGGVTYTVTGLLKEDNDGGIAPVGIYVSRFLPYIHSSLDGTLLWQNVTITREVEVPKFKPGTVIRFGKDPTLYIRNNNGTWASAYIGWANLAPYAKANAYHGDGSLRESVENGYATIVYNPEEAS